MTALLRTQFAIEVQLKRQEVPPESFYNVATEIENIGATKYYGGVSLHAQSHGEESRAGIRI